MTSPRKETGQRGEALARDYLLRRGYTILAQNWRCSAGEIDLVAQQGNTLVFVEVRTRHGDRLGSPEESVSPAKQAKLIELAYTYLAQTGCPDSPWRIDVIALLLNPREGVARFNHIESAVGGF